MWSYKPGAAVAKTAAAPADEAYSSSIVSAGGVDDSSSSSFLLFPGQHGASHEEEIYVSGCTAVWSTGHVPVTPSSSTANTAAEPTTSEPVSRVLKSFSHSVPVLSAVLTRFPTLSPTANQPPLSIVLVHPDSLSVYTASDVYSVPLPFHVSSAHPLLEGLLLARSTPATPDHAATPATPCLFSLLHPLEEVRPLARVRGGEGEAEYMVDDQERVVWASDQQPLLLTYQTAQRRHRLYIIRQSRRERHKRLKAAPSLAADGQVTGGDVTAEGFAAHLLAADSEGLAAASDRVIASELLLECCWADVSAVAECTDVFLASTADGQPLLCMCGRQPGLLNTFFLRSISAAVPSLDMYSSPFLIAVEAAFSIPALSACSTRRLFSHLHSSDASSALANDSTSAPTNPYDHDIVVLSPDRRLSVYCGEQLLYTLNSASLPTGGLRLSQAVMDRFCLHTGSECFRVQLPAAVQSAVVSACLQALAYVLPVDAIVAIKRDWLSRQHARGVRSATRAEWQQFASLMLDLLSPLPSTAHTIDSASTVSPAFVPLSSSSVSPLSPTPSRSASRRTRHLSTSPVPDHQSSSDAWSALLVSSTHRRYAAYPLLTKLRSSTTVSDSTQPHASHEQKRQKTTPVSPSASARPLVQPYAADVLLMLHLVYEEHKLDELLSAHLQPLATMCHAIARRLGSIEWCEQYQRDCAGLRMAGSETASPAAVAAPVNTLLLSPPPSIHRWVYQRLLHPPPLAQPFPLPADAVNDDHSPFPLLRRVCECFELMTEATLTTSQYSLSDDAADGSLDGLTSVASNIALPSSLSTPSLRALSTPQSPFSVRPSRKRRETPSSSLSLHSTHSTTSVASRAGLLDISEDSHPLFSPSSARRASAGRVRADSLSSSVAGVSAAFRVALLSNFDGGGLARLPFGLSLPLYQHLYDMRHSPSAALSAAALELIGRPELACMQASSTVAVPDTPGSALLEKMERAAGQPQPEPPPLPPSTIADDHPADTDGTLLTLRIASSRFAADLRLKQVRHLLRSNRVVHATLSAARIQQLLASATAPPDVLVEQQARLLTLSRRLLSLPVGRGMLTLGSVNALLTRPWIIPELIVKGIGTGVGGAKAATNDIELDASTLAADYWDWPQFNNGAAAALRIRPSMRPGETCVTRSFILFNRPATLDFSHAGWLLGLGLNGGLACLTAADLYSYLSQHHDATTVALLLGMAAVKRGSLDLTASKMLCLHLPAFLPPHLQSEVSGVVRAAAVVGIGLVYEGSAHRLMTDVLLGEVEGRGRGKDKDNGNDAERTGYALAAGFGLGLVLLGRGGNATGVSDLHIEDRLIALLQHNTQLSSINDESTTATSTPLHNLDVTAPAATLALALMYFHSNNADIVSHLTIPATHYELDYVKAEYLLLRTMARGLIMSDGVQATREWVEGQVPTIVADNVNGVDKYCGWPGAGGGKVARKLSEKAKSSVAREWADDDDDDENMSGAANVSKPAAELDLDSIILDSDDERTYAAKAHQPSRPQPLTSKRVHAPASRVSDLSDDGEMDDDLDYEAIRQAYCNIVAGACLALGFHQAGTADAAAASLLSYYVRVFRNIRFKLPDHSHTLFSSSPTPLHHVDRYTLESCLHSCLFALCLVMAGTGDLATLRLLLSTRQRVEERSAFSREQGWAMCLGLLFLGGGEWSVKRGKSAIGPLLLSLFPTFPSGGASNDNRLYMQPLRHMYALSAECRAMKAIDVDGGGECYCQLEVTMKDDGRQVMRLVTPCLLPEVSGIKTVRLVDERYWPITVSFATSATRASGTTASDVFIFPARTCSPYKLHVKQQSSRILRSLDATSFVGTLDRIAQQHWPSFNGSVANQPAHVPAAAVSADSASDDSRLLAAVCDRDDVGCVYRWLVAESDGQEREQLVSWLLECVRDDKMHVLPLLLRIRLQTAEAGVLDASGVWNLRCVEQFYQQRHARHSAAPAVLSLADGNELVSANFRSRLQYRLESQFSLSPSSSLSGVFRSYLSPHDSALSLSSAAAARVSLTTAAACRQLSCYLTYADMPSAHVLTAGMAVLRETAAGLDGSAGAVGAGRGKAEAALLPLLLPIAGLIWPSLSSTALKHIVDITVQAE